MVRVTSLLILILGISGCSTWNPKPFPCPFRPPLTALTQEQRDTIPDDIYEVVAGNQILLKGYAKKLEKRAGCDSE